MGEGRLLPLWRGADLGIAAPYILCDLQHHLRKEGLPGPWNTTEVPMEEFCLFSKKQGLRWRDWILMIDSEASWRI